MKHFLLLILVLVAYQDSWADKRLPIISDIQRIKDVTDPDISADGLWVTYTVYKQDLRNDSWKSDIWRVSFDGKQSNQLTFSEDSTNYSPKWSPDGKWIAFISDQSEDGSYQVWKMSKGGGVITQMTHMKGSVSEFAWSPDSQQLALIVEDEYDDDAYKPIVVDRYVFKNDGVGYVTKVFNHLYVYDIASQKIIQLTSGNHDEWSPSWSPNGKYIAYGTKRGLDPDKTLNADIYLIEPKVAAPEVQLTHYIGSDQLPEWDSTISWSPDGTKIAYLRGNVDKWIYYAPAQLMILNINDKSEQELAPIDRVFTKPKWSADGQKILALIEESRNTYLSEIDVHTGAVKHLTQGLRLDTDFVLSKDNIVVLSTDDLHPAELYVLAQPLRQLTNHNKALLDEVLFQPTEDIDFPSADKTIIHGLLMKPANYQQGTKYPAILNLHGGPVYQFSHEFDFESQWFAANGYAVISPNPRGSSGRGFEFSKAIYADWGNLDVKDVLAAVDYTVNMGVVDPQKLAIGGWSYGSMLTDYVIASDPRFKAGVSGAGTANILANYGVDQYTFEYEMELGKPWEKLDTYLKLSYPFFHSYKIKTPTLFMCANLDVNMPCVGAEQLYQALKSQNVPTQLVVYPNQHHSLDIPSFVVDRLQRSTDWIRAYVK